MGHEMNYELSSVGWDAAAAGSGPEEPFGGGAHMAWRPNGPLGGPGGKIEVSHRRDEVRSLSSSLRSWSLCPC